MSIKLTNQPCCPRATRFESTLTDDHHGRAAQAARACGYTHYAFGFLGRHNYPNVELFDEATGSRAALNGRSLRPVKRPSWNPKHLTRKFRA